MSHPKALLRCRLVGALAAIMLWAAAVPAQIADALVLQASQTSGLAVKLQPGESVGHEQVLREFIRSGTNEFMFVAPEGLRTETAPDGRIVLISRDMSYYVSIRLVASSSPNSELKAALREQIVSQYACLSSVEEFATTVAGHEGTGFQLRQALPNVGGRLIRIVRVPFKAGVLEIALNADEAQASAGQGALDIVLLTLRSNERGKIEIVKRSDKT